MFYEKNLLVASLLFLMIGCEKDEISPQNEEGRTTGKTLKEIRFGDLPQSIAQHFDKENSIKQQGDGTTGPFGGARTDMPVKKIIGENGRVSYTIVLESKNKKRMPTLISFSTTWLFFKTKEKVDGIYVVRYEPTKKWYENSRDFMDYSGKITFYTVEGEKLNSIDLVDGEMPKNKDRYKGSCELVYDGQEYICTEIIDRDGSWGEYCTTTYYYTWECSSGGGGGEYDGNNGGPREPGQLPSGGDGSYTPPTLPDPPEDIILHYEKYQEPYGNDVEITEKKKIKSNSEATPLYTLIQVFEKPGRPKPGAIMVIRNKNQKIVMAFMSDSEGFFPNLSIYDNYIEDFQISALGKQETIVSTDTLFGFRTNIIILFEDASKTKISKETTEKFLIKEITDHGIELLSLEGQELILLKKN